jgi:hypothetical protein
VPGGPGGQFGYPVGRERVTEVRYRGLDFGKNREPIAKTRPATGREKCDDPAAYIINRNKKIIL